ncbi:G-protein coupled receptor GRL101-like [Littorina saxatilis]
MRPLALSDLSNASFACPESHFMCVTTHYCFPVYVRCNGVHDCPGREDEADCPSYTCPGFYRCRGSAVCLHTRHLCDDIPQCPEFDDEIFCNLGCPTNCTCHGLSYLCTQPFSAHLHLAVRYLDVRDSGMQLTALSSNTMLVFLSLARCGVMRLDDVNLPNLRSLDLSDNQIASVSVANVKRFPNLQVLFLAGNPIVFLFTDNDSLSSEVTTLRHLDLSRVPMAIFEFSAVAPFRQLEKLNLSHSGAQQLLEGRGGEQKTFSLRVLDVRGCPANSFSRTLFQGMQGLQVVYADNYKLCCPAMMPPGLSASKCWAPTDEVSSCDALLRSDVYRVALSVFAALALTGNLVSFIVRGFVETKGKKSGFLAFVIHLCVADFLMGAYLVVIGTADRLYLGNYLWEEVGWRNSQTCAVAGFLCILSSEVSAMNICLITLDRFLVLRFPFSQAHFHLHSAHSACVVTWLVGCCVAAVPLLPVTSHWRFYSQTGICVPLPITRTDFAGRDYAFAVMIVFNFLLFVFIAVGQLFIYVSVNMNKISVAAHTANVSRDARIARRLAVVVVSDFTCWFPIGLLGVLARSGAVIPGEVNVAMAILVLPLNSAINPFLYTLNMVLERRQRAAEERLLQQLLLHRRNTNPEGQKETNE